MDSAIVPTGPLSGEVMFYKNPEPLNIESHAKLGLNPSTTPFAFAKAAHAVPLVISEFGPSSLHYPIIFAGRDFQPLAIMSVRADHNLFVGDAGVFEVFIFPPSSAAIPSYSPAAVPRRASLLCASTGVRTSSPKTPKCRFSIKPNRPNLPGSA
jgi:hypothetical protein